MFSHVIFSNICFSRFSFRMFCFSKVRCSKFSFCSFSFSKFGSANLALSHSALAKKISLSNSAVAKLALAHLALVDLSLTHLTFADLALAHPIGVMMNRVGAESSAASAHTRICDCRMCWEPAGGSGEREGPATGANTSRKSKNAYNKQSLVRETRMCSWESFAILTFLNCGAYVHTIYLDSDALLCMTCRRADLLL